MYLPRICNHCANPSCVAACPSGALYKRGEDGIVLVNQDKCRGWRACVTACPYKKVYYNWKTGKSEKCILCYPRLESGQAPACFHSCVGRIRYMGVLLYDAERVVEAMKAPAASLVEAQRSAILDPFDPQVMEAARANGVTEEFLKAAQDSPVYKYVVKWKLALPLHVEFRTMPMLFYVPPLLPVMGKQDASLYEPQDDGFFTALTQARMPIRFLAKLFGAGNERVVEESLRRLMAVRYFMRSLELNDVDPSKAQQAMREAGLSEAEARAIHALTALPTVDDRFVLPPLQREGAIEQTMDPEVCKGCTGFGAKEPPHRGA
jgi:nitrate reductase beta subunit